MDRVCRILAVDNETAVTTSLRFVFDSPRYNITCVSSGADALAHLNCPTPFDVIIVDQKMPNLTGVELVREIRKRRIDGKIIVVSANLTAEVCEAYKRDKSIRPRFKKYASIPYDQRLMSFKGSVLLQKTGGL